MDKWQLLGNGGVRMWIPCLPAPKGSSRAVQIPIKGKHKCPACGNVPKVIAFIAGSADSTKDKQRDMEKEVRGHLLAFVRAHPRFRPFDSAVDLDCDFIFKAPASRMKDHWHTTYPDRDKVLRMFSDLICPPKKNKEPDYDAPHLVRNDSMIPSGRADKWYLHTWNNLHPTLEVQESGVYFTITPKVMEDFSDGLVSPRIA